MVLDSTILETLIPKEEWQTFMQGRQEEYLQSLMDLGYLAIDQVKNQPAILAAMQLFRSEYQQLGWLAQEMELPQPDWVDAKRPPDELEIKLLHLLVDMDGDFEIEVLPLEGERNVVSRVLYFRLKVLGLNSKVAIDAPYKKTVVEELFAPLRNWTGLQVSMKAMINLAGNVPEMIRTVWKFGALDREVVCFQYLPELAFDEDFKKEVAAESDATVKKENKTLENIAKEAADLIPKKDKARLRRQFSKQLKRQSESEQLRAQIEAILADLQKELNQQLNTGSQLEGQIKTLETQIKEENLKRNHLKEDVKELKRQEKQMKSLQKESDQLQKDKKKKQKQIDPQINYREQLKLQLHLLQQLVDKQNQAPASLQHRFDIPIQSAQKKIQAFQEKIKCKQDIAQIEARQQDILQILTQHASTGAEIKEKKAVIDQLAKSLKGLKRQLSKLNKQKEKEQAAFAQALAEAQATIVKKKAKFDRLLEKLNKIPRRFRRELENYLATDYFKKVNDELLNRQDSTFFDLQLKNAYNHFLIRLIQLHQWTSGYYNGMLDSNLGERTFNSIREIDKDVKALKLRFVLYQVDAQKGTWLLNIRYFFDEMIAELDTFKEKPDFETVVTSFEKELTENPKIRSKKKEFDRQWRKAIRETQKDLKENVVRRIYFGIRSIARSIIRGIKRIISLIFSGIKKLFRLLRNFVHLLYREIREGLKKFAQGISFLFGKRTIQTANVQGELAVITRYDFDCDVINIADTKNKTILKEHIAKNFEVVHNLDFSLILVGKVIDWVFKFTLLGYAGILIRIALYFRKLVRRFFRKRIFGLGVKLLL